MAPVTQFCVLISVFVIAIGPVNYWLLRRRRQLHLLLLTIPASAAVGDAAVVRLCLGGRRPGRARAGAERHPSRSTQRPGGLLDAAVVLRRPVAARRAALSRRHRGPALGTIARRRQSASSRCSREVLWDEDQQLASGWLASRTPTQFLTVRSRMSGIGLDLLDARGQGEGPRRAEPPANADPAPAGADQGRQVLPGRVRSASAPRPRWSRSPRRPTPACWRCSSDDKLLAPPGMAAGVPGGGFGPGSGLTWHVRSNPNRCRTRPSRPAGWSRCGRCANMPPGSYVAVVERSPEVVLGVPSPREEPSSHVIIGQW